MNILGSFQHDNTVTDLDFIGNNFLISSSIDKTVAGFNVPSCSKVSNFSKQNKLSYAGPIAISRNSNILIVGTLYGRVFNLQY